MNFSPFRVMTLPAGWHTIFTRWFFEVRLDVKVVKKSSDAILVERPALNAALRRAVLSIRTMSLLDSRAAGIAFAMAPVDVEAIRELTGEQLEYLVERGKVRLSIDTKFARALKVAEARDEKRRR